MEYNKKEKKKNQTEGKMENLEEDIVRLSLPPSLSSQFDTYPTILIMINSRQWFTALKGHLLTFIYILNGVSEKNIVMFVCVDTFANQVWKWCRFQPQIYPPETLVKCYTPQPMKKRQYTY